MEDFNSTNVVIGGVHICFITMTGGGMNLVSEEVGSKKNMSDGGVRIQPMVSGVCIRYIIVTSGHMYLVSGGVVPTTTMFGGCMTFVSSWVWLVDELSIL